MAIFHPNLPLFPRTSLGEIAELAVFKLLGHGLSDEYDVFCNLPNSGFHNHRATFGEFDAVILSPQGHALILEIKAGALNAQDGGLSKTYLQSGDLSTKDVLKQSKGQHAALVGSLRSAQLVSVRVGHLLVLPHHAVQVGTVSHPRESIVDQTQMDQLCSLVLARFAQDKAHANAANRHAALDFLSNAFNLAPSTSARIAHAQRASVALADGLATWVPRIQCATQAYAIQATAGSGKTQLAILLLKAAARSKQRCAYVCFNRPLADHMQTLCPATAQVTTFHELCVTAYQKTQPELNFAQGDLFKLAAAYYLERCLQAPPMLDLIIIDEAQDFEPTWVEAFIAQLKPSGKIYVMGDADQAIYDKEAFDLDGAVTITSHDNFRSPRKVVQAINALRLCSQPIVPRSAFEGQSPNFHTYANPAEGGLKQTQRCVQNLLDDGVELSQITLLSYAGRAHSKLLATSALGVWPLRRYTGAFDANGNPQWTAGTLHADTLHRYKGQAAPVIVLCEIDFEAAPSSRDLSKLFIGFTRAQYRLECVISERAAVQLSARVE